MNEQLQHWIYNNEKYALIGLKVGLSNDISNKILTKNFSILTGTTFYIPLHWKEWLGTIRTKEIEQCNLFLLCKKASTSPNALDDENENLLQHINYFYYGLMLSCRFSPSHRPIILTGSCIDGEVGVRQQSDLAQSISSITSPHHFINVDDIYSAANIGENLARMMSIHKQDDFWRFARALKIFSSARVEADIIDRIHQYCRCIEGVILPDQGSTTKQFQTRTTTFIGPDYYSLMKELFDIRSAAEHLHEGKYLEPFNRKTRLSLVKYESISEYISRKVLSHIILHDSLWPHFSNVFSLKNFWLLDEKERGSFWGPTFNPLEVLKDFDPEMISDQTLGLQI